MIELILHGIGDYYLQTDWQALNKKKNNWACFKHCLTYSLPFLFIASWKAWIIIFITHYIIDRTTLVDYLIAIKNNTVKYVKIDEYNDGLEYDISNFGFSIERPFVISFWLYVICDNLLHIICNHLALKYL